MEQSKACSLRFCKYSIYISSSRIAYFKKNQGFFFLCECMHVCAVYIHAEARRTLGMLLVFGYAGCPELGLQDHVIMPSFLCGRWHPNSGLPDLTH